MHKITTKFSFRCVCVFFPMILSTFTASFFDCQSIWVVDTYTTTVLVTLYSIALLIFYRTIYNQLDDIIVCCYCLHYVLSFWDHYVAYYCYCLQYVLSFWDHDVAYYCYCLQYVLSFWDHDVAYYCYCLQYVLSFWDHYVAYYFLLNFNHNIVFCLLSLTF